MLLLDEPSTGLDPEQRRVMVELIKGLELTVLMSSHVLEDVVDAAGRVIVLDEGRVAFDGSVQALASHAPRGLTLPVLLRPVFSVCSRRHEASERDRREAVAEARLGHGSCACDGRYRARDAVLAKRLGARVGLGSEPGGRGHPAPGSAHGGLGGRRPGAPRRAHRGVARVQLARGAAAIAALPLASWLWPWLRGCSVSWWPSSWPGVAGRRATRRVRFHRSSGAVAAGGVRGPRRRLVLPKRARRTGRGHHRLPRAAVARQLGSAPGRRLRCRWRHRLVDRARPSASGGDCLLAVHLAIAGSAASLATVGCRRGATSTSGGATGLGRARGGLTRRLR